MKFCPHDGQNLEAPTNDWDAIVAQAAPRRKPSHAVEPGDTLGQYHLLSRIGEGGMGAVFKAEHQLLGRQVAVKVLLGELNDNREVVQRFFNEARAVNKIQHPNIVDITDFVESTDRAPAFMVMELIDGRCLADVIDEQGPLALEHAVSIARQVCDAMAEVHRNEIVHRDLKTENIMLLNPNLDRAKLLDFGIAKFLATEKAFLKTATGQTIGTPEYMAPEQIRGKEVDKRTDIYAMGIILYEMLTGTLPFKATNLGDLFTLQLSRRPTPPSQVLTEHGRTGIPPAIESIVLTCLEKDPDARIQTMDELSQRLESALDDDGEITAVTSLTPASPRGHKVLVVSLIAAVAVLAVSAMTILRYHRGAERDADRQEPSRSAKTDGRPPEQKAVDAATRAPAMPNGTTQDASSGKAGMTGSNRKHPAGPTATKQPPPPRKVTIATKPAHSLIFRKSDGAFLGQAPISVAVHGQALLIKKQGYRTVEISVTTETKPTLSVALKRLRHRRHRHSRRHGGRTQGSSAGTDTWGTVNPFKKGK